MKLNMVRILGIAAIVSIAFFNTCTPALAQQNVIANKDVTRPVIQDYNARPGLITMVKAEKRNGYNLISWASRDDQDIQRFIVEFSTDAVNYQSAGEVSLHGGTRYELLHHIMEDRPLIYRVNMQMKNNRTSYSASTFLDGVSVSPVTFYPTTITGNTINVSSAWPLQRMTITSTGGAQVFARDLNGQDGDFPVVIPRLAGGIYIITFYGTGWQRSGKLVSS